MLSVTGQRRLGVKREIDYQRFYSVGVPPLLASLPLGLRGVPFAVQLVSAAVLRALVFLFPHCHHKSDDL